MLDALLLELEGVLVDSRDARRVALRQSLAEDGVLLGDAECAAACDGLPVRASVATALALRAERRDATAVELIALRAARAFTTRLSRGVVLQPGARDAVEALHGRARLAIVTRARRDDVHLVLGMAGLEHAFECVVCEEEVLDPKPAPDGYAQALRKLARRRSMRAGAALALEDGRPGIAAARAAGLRCVAVGALPAYDAMEADGYVASLGGETLESLDAAGRRGRERV